MVEPRVRVLHVYRTYFPDTQGGLEETIRQICLNTRGPGAEPSVFTLSKRAKPSRIEHDGTQVIRCQEAFELASCNVSFRALGAFRRAAANSDVIHYHFPWPFGDLLHLAGRPDRPALVTYHSDIVRQKMLGKLYEPLRDRFLASLDRIVCTSPNYFATSNVLPKFENKVDIVPIGLNESTYEPVRDEVLESAKSEHGSDFFLFVGVLRYYKGLHILLDAIVDAPYRVLIVGSGPTEGELRAQVQRLGLDNVTFTGYVPNPTKSALFKLCRGVVFPSYLRSEAFGVTLLEGAMYGKPLISTEVGSGTSHVNLNGTTGVVVPPGSPGALRDAMNKLWFHPNLASLMGRRARERYEDLFTGELMGLRYYEIYKRLIEEQGNQSSGTNRRLDKAAKPLHSFSGTRQPLR